MQKQLFALSVLLFAALSQAEISLGGSCPDIPTVQNFNATAYCGKWYEYGKYPFLFELGGKCVKAQYAPLPNGGVSVLNTQINELTGKEQTIEGSAKEVSSAKLDVTFPSVPFGFGKAPYWILATDYDNYAVVWSCSKVLFLRTKVLWCLTRAQNPKEEVINKCKAVAAKYNLSWKDFIVTDQKNC